MAAATTLIQTQTPFVVFPNEFQLPYIPRNTNHVSFRCQNNNNNNKSQKYEYQRFRVYSSTPKSKPISTYKNPISVFLTERLGFSEERSLSISKTLLHIRDTKHVQQVTDLMSFENADNVISFFENKNECGFGLSQIKKMVSKLPKILEANVDETLKPKIKLLKDLGFSTSDLALVLSQNPGLYLEHDLSLAIQALRDVMGSDEYVVKFFMRLTRGNAASITKNLIPNVSMMENEYGIPRENIRKFMIQTPQFLIWRTEWVRDILVRTEENWGISRDSKEFLRAVRAFCKKDDIINTKCQVFKSFGWSQSDILTLIRRLPNCIGYSEARVKRSLDFYMNELGYKPDYLATRGNLLSCSLENRVMPRHRVLSILKENMLIKPDYQLSSCVILTDKKFYDKFISPYENYIPELREIFINGRVPSEGHMEASENETETLVLPNVG